MEWKNAIFERASLALSAGRDVARRRVGGGSSGPDDAAQVAAILMRFIESISAV
ncbi:MAG: hypothetical protein LUC40_05190 [Oscillospiraceae bacterium]|nr:hypothetical protein [Oscillospiraceae bacterium]